MCNNTNIKKYFHIPILIIGGILLILRIMQKNTKNKLENDFKYKYINTGYDNETINYINYYNNISKIYDMND